MAFNLSDIPKTRKEPEPLPVIPLNVPEPAIDEPAPMGIPQSAAPPAFVNDTFGENPWDVADRKHQQDLNAWTREGTDNLDRAIFEPAAAFKDVDFTWADSPEQGQRDIINDSWLELHTDEPTAPTPLLRAAQIQRASLAQFGQMVDDDEKLYDLIHQDATKRKDRRQLGRDLTAAAFDDAMLPSDKAPGYAAFREKLKTHAGYSAEKEADYAEAWYQTRRAAAEKVDEFREPLVQVWRAFKTDGDVTAAAFDAYAKLTMEQRPAFMDALAIRAQALPVEERSTFWANMGKATTRSTSDFYRNAAESATSMGLAQPTDPGVGIADAVFGGTAYTASESGRKLAASNFQQARNFAADVRRVAREDYDPLKSAFGDGEGKPGFWENIAYQSPGVVSTSMTMAVPVLGMPLMALSMEGQAYEGLRGRMMASGLDDATATSYAEGLAPFVALPQVALEKAGFALWSRKLPGVSKVIDKLGDQIANRALRFATKTGTIGVAETGIELVQDVTEYAVQDLGHALAEDIPDVDWGKELQGTWATAPEIFFTMLPLAILGAAGGLSQESRHAAFARATPTQLQALGINTDGIAAISAANGPASLASAVDSAMASRDPNSPEAVAAVGALKLQLDTQRQARTKLEELGYQAPSFVQSPEGITVFDGAGQELGTAPDLSGAVRIARAATVALDDMEADQVAALGSLMEAAAAAVKLDPSSTVEVNLGEFDPEQATPEMAARFAAQVALKEQAEGGTGDIARSVLGYSVTEMAQGVRNTVNRLFRGASVTDVFHETFHGLRRQARAAGTITRTDEIAMLRALDTVLAGKMTKDGVQLRFIPDQMADDQVSETLLDEAFSEIAEMEILRTRKGQGKGKLGLTRGVISRNLTALAKLIPGVAGKWTAFMQAVRARWGLSLSRALAMKKAERDGTFDKTGYDAYLDKILGLDQQTEHDAGVKNEFDRILGLPEELADDDIPFSIGRMGPGPRQISAAPEVVSLSNPFASDVSEPSALRRDFWSRFSEITKAWPKTIETPEGPIAWSKSKTGDKLRSFKDGEPALLHFIAAANLPTLLQNSKLAAVEDESKRDRQVAEVHRRYAWADFPNGDRRHVLLTVDRMSEHAAAEKQKADQAYSSEVLGVSLEVLGENKSADVVNLKAGGDSSPSYQAVTPAQEESTRFHAGIKPEHRWVESAQFSLGPAQVAGILSDNALARITDPRRRTHVMSRIARDFNAMRLQIERITSLSGIRRSKGDMRREAAAREDLAAEEKIGAIHARFGSLLADEDLVKIKAQPVNAYLAVTRADGKADPFRGRLKSKAQAIKDSPDLFQLHRVGDYDGSDGVSRSVFGGNLMPDQAAQELFDNHLIAEPTADAMWQALLVEQNTVAKFKELLVQAQEEIRQAKRAAKQEANEWLATQGKDQEVNFSDKEEIRRSLRMLDAILLALPAEIRGKIGGYTQISMIGSDDARLAYLKDKLAKADKELETYLRVEYAKEWEALLEKAAPKTNEAGQRPTGSIAADAYDIFRIAEAAMGMSFAAGEAEADKYDAIADHPDTEEKDIDLARVKAQMIRLTMNWAAADAARREQAVLEGDKIYFDGLRGLAIENSRRRERLAKLRDSAIAGTGKTGSRMQRKAAEIAAKSTKGREALQMAWEFLSFGQVADVLFGEESAAARWLNARELAASNAFEDAFQAKANAIEALFTTLSGNRFDGEALKHRMSTVDTITVKDARGEEHTFTDSAAITFLLMWRQEDGQRHMRGLIDEETGEVLSGWAWDDASAAAIEAGLSQQGHAAMAFLGQSYGEEYGRINEVFRRIWNVSMPRHKMYSPLSVAPVQGKGDTIMDPVSGDTMSAGMTPGSLKNRSFSAIAEPLFKDAFQVYVSHARQMEHFIAYGEFARDSLAIVNRRETRNAIEAAGGPFAAGVLSKWLDFFAVGGVKDANMGGAIARTVGGALGRLSQAALVGRVSVLAMQSLQLTAAAYQMPVGAYLTRLAKLGAGRLDWSAAVGSEYIQRRIAIMPPIVRDAVQGLASGTPNRAKYYAAQLGKTISGADALFTGGTYAIFYDYHLKLAKQSGIANPEAHAHREAERLTDQVAQPVRMGARSWVEVANQGNPAFRAMWNFSSDPRQKIALVVYEAMRKDKKGTDKAAALGKALTLTWIGSGVLSAVLRSVMRDIRADDDDEWFDERYWSPKRLGLMAILGPLGGMPYLGEVIENTSYKLTGEYMPAGGMLAGIGQSLSLIPKWAEGDIDVLKDAEKIFTDGAALSHTSAAAASAMHILRDAWGIIENLEGPD